MNIIDLHCDTASKLLYDNISLLENKESVDIKKMIKGKIGAQVFAHFIDINGLEDPFQEFIKMNERLIDEINKNNKYIEVVTNIEEMERANELGKIGAFLSIEEGEVLQGDIEKLKKVYQRGIRIITLTWNYKNSLGYPNINYIYKEKGLDIKGKEIVLEMEKLGVIPDCSHLSDKGFYDLIEICKKPFIASHSNSRTITNHSRNLTDDMIKLLANKGGVMGLNFCNVFTGKENITTIDSMIAHLKHIKNIGGIDVIALGSDFDGINNEVEIKDISEIDKLGSQLLKNGFTENDIEKIYNKNVIRVLKDTLK